MEKFIEKYEVIHDLMDLYEIKIEDGKAIPNDVPDSIIAENIEEFIEWFVNSLYCDYSACKDGKEKVKYITLLYALINIEKAEGYNITTFTE